jgi:hypothetical protein
MKKLGMVFLVIPLFVLFLSCASKATPVSKAYTDGESTIIVSRTDTMSDVVINLILNSEDIGTINIGQSKTLTVSNGKHSISANMAGKITSKTLELNNEWQEVRVWAFSSDEYGILVVVSPGTITPLHVSPKLDEKAISQSFNNLSSLISSGLKIAIINITTSNANDGIFVIEELLTMFVNTQKYIIVDRQTLDVIRREQNFQMEGEVSDDSAVSIGKLAGAEVVITGNITGTGDQRRLRLRALDVKTGQILAMSSEKI